MPSGRAAAVVQTFINILFVSMGYVLAKRALINVGPLTFVWLTIAVGMLVLSFHTFILRQERIPVGLGWKIWAYIAIVGLGNFTIARVALTLALERLPAITHSYLLNYVGLVTMALSVLILRELPSAVQIIGVGIAMVGTRVFFLEAPPSQEPFGVALVLIGILAIGYANNYARKLALVSHFSLSNNFISTAALLIGGSITILICIALEWPPKVFGLANWLIILYFGAIWIAFSQTQWNHILRTLRTYEASVLTTTSPFITAILALPVLGERLTVNQLAGTTILMVGLVLVYFRKKKSSSVPQASE